MQALLLAQKLLRSLLQGEVDGGAKIFWLDAEYSVAELLEG